MIETIKTTEKTFNKKVKAQLVELFPAATHTRKLHVAGMGYVIYIKNANGDNLGYVYKEIRGGMNFSINR